MASSTSEESLSLLAYELRGSLTVLRGYALTLGRRWAELQPVQVADSLAAIARRSEDLADLADELLDCARAEGNRLELRREVIDLRGALAVSLARAQDEEPGSRILLRCPADVLPACVDPVLFVRVVRVLLALACRSAHAGSYVVLSARPVSRGVLVRVCSPVDRASERPVSVLRLRFCRLVVEAHGGRMWMAPSSSSEVNIVVPSPS
jgi:signal transduction histidine kinase